MTGSATLDLVFPWKPGDDPVVLLSREWLVTNGLGGYAAGTLYGAATRRYHGIFVPNLPAPKGRTVMIPRLDEWVHAGQRIWLGGAEFADGRLEGDSPRVLKEFRLLGLMPQWRFEVDGRLIEKRVLMPHEQNTVYIRYRLLEGSPVRLDLRPFMTCRMHDAALFSAPEWPFTVMITQRRYEIHLREGVPPLKIGLRTDPLHSSHHAPDPLPRRDAAESGSWPLGRATPQGVFVADEEISHEALYRVERDRGYDHIEDLYSPGYISADLSQDHAITFVASTESWEGLDDGIEASFEREATRTKKLRQLAGDPEPGSFGDHLVLAADQFLILPGSRPEEEKVAHAAGDDVRTVVAGYHWFTDWGRDTMISLDGLMLCTGRHQEAKAILRTFARYIKGGLLPNHFPEGQRTAIYNTADATLWFFHALDRYIEVTGDQETLRHLYPALSSVLAYHISGTDFGIGMDPNDGLLKAGVEGYQLTWMDALVDGWVVTPRHGKPAEIQALWYNAIRLMAKWAGVLGERFDDWLNLATRVHESFNARFWYEPAGHLYDVVDGQQGDDPSLRPNQIFSFSLAYPILRQDRWRQVLDVVTDRLLTPVGLRSLAPGHRDYKSQYFGDLRARDAAYHQGTVWAWLIGHFLDAWMRVHSDQARARAMLDGFIAHLRDAGVGTISEIFDAEPPYAPRGCIAQAWSVAEVLRAWKKLREGGGTG